MAAVVANVAKGRVAELHDRVDGNDPTNSALIIVFLTAAEGNSTLQDYDDLSTLLGAAGNTEATYTNYARLVLTDSDISASTVDDSGNTRTADFADQTPASQGNGTNQTVVKVLVCYDSDTTAGTDANIEPMTIHDANFTTDGSALRIATPSTGYFRAS